MKAAVGAGAEVRLRTEDDQMELDWPTGFDTWLDRMEKAAENGEEHATVVVDYVTAAMEKLSDLEEPPTEDVASLKWVRQSRRHTLWRGSPMLSIRGSRSG
jgi:hypothetical protein